MNIVLDTNVLVAGLLTPFGPSGEIVRMVSSGMLTLCFDARILTEYSEVLRRPKFRFDEDKVAAFLDYIGHSGCMAATAPLQHALPDPDDEPFLQAAIAARVACLVTGNLRHFPPHFRQGTKILSPREFLAFYGKQQERKRP